MVQHFVTGISKGNVLLTESTQKEEVKASFITL